MTRQKKAIQQALEQASSPMSVAELIEALKAKKLPVNKTTVYRILDALIRTGAVASVDFGDGKRRFELVQGGHHHHAVCVSCHDVRELDIEPDISRIESKIKRQSGFRLERHQIEFFGLCGKCK